ncbi:ORF49-like protein [Bufonid herpesvirus 1]|uniref:ORF49-like protein n=1 Tax=Bufonid herpesvirus 1 TaxID=2282206 RepID=UPI000EB7147A|nr:ORF49-like protein [Bufonid herpesvirus 1]AXF48597.1 ORF49-like protein [Bufonid herpesvirus 1]
MYSEVQQKSTVRNPNMPFDMVCVCDSGKSTQSKHRSGQRIFSVDQKYEGSFLNGYMKPEMGDSGFRLASMHVNTVYNRKQRVCVTLDRARIKRVQNSTIKSQRNKFVSDKKKCVSVDGLRMTRIEFNQTSIQSSNYTINTEALNHETYLAYFDLLCRAQGETLSHKSNLVVNNINYTSCLYGVTNAFAVDSRLKADKDYNRAFSFPACINWKGSSVRNMTFPSMYLNSQKLQPTEVLDLGTELANMAGYIEPDYELNKFCVSVFMSNRTFINTPNKMVALLLHETYKAWGIKADHFTFMQEHYAQYANDMYSICAQLTNQYCNKNATFTHIIPILFMELAAGKVLTTEHLLKSYITRTCLKGGESLCELIHVLHECSKLPHISVHIKHQSTSIKNHQEEAIHVGGKLFLLLDTSRRSNLPSRLDQVLQKKIQEYCDIVFGSFFKQNQNCSK